MRALYILSSLLFALSAFANATFTIERVEVRGAQRTSPRLLAAETLLREGSEVSEDDVRAAVRRLGRLPFVFEADYTLERGSDDTRRVVVINVRENARFWFLLDARGIHEEDPAETIDYAYPDPSAEWKHAAAGARWLFGDGGVAHFALTVFRTRHAFAKNYSAYELGYTRHRIAGTRLFATAIVRSPVDSLEEYTFSGEFIAGLPLTADQTLTLAFEDTVFERGTTRLIFGDFRRIHGERTISAAWTFDTRNEPYTPTRGTFARIEPFAWMSDQSSFSTTFGPPPQRIETIALHSNARGIDLAAEHHWPLSEVHSVSAALQAGWASVDNRRNPPLPSGTRDWRSSFQIVEGGYTRKLGRSYVQLEGRVLRRDADDLGPDATGTSFEAGAAWVRRSPRATLRFGFAYSTK